MPDHEPDWSDWKAEVRRRLPGVSASSRDLDIVEEVAQHLESRYRELLDRGVAPHEARQEVLASLDADPPAGRGAHADAAARARAWRPATASLPAKALPGRGRRFLGDATVQDCRYALRMFARRPAFTVVAVAAIAIGVAAITTVFSLVSTVLGDSPVSQFDRIVLIWQQDPTVGRDRITLWPLEFAEYRRAPSFEATAAIRGVRLNVSPRATTGSGGTPLAVSGIQVSPDPLQTLGVTPFLGRGFSTSANQRAQEVMITHEFWQSHLAADPGILGTPLAIRAGFSTEPDAARYIDGTRVIVGPTRGRRNSPW